MATKGGVILAIAVSVLVLFAVIYFIYPRVSEEGLILIAGTTPIKENETYKFSVALCRQIPYYQTIKIENNYTLTKVSIFVIQMNRSYSLQLELSVMNTSAPMNGTTIGSKIIDKESFDFYNPGWVEVPFNLPLYAGNIYKLTLAPYPNDGYGSYRWFVTEDNYKGGQLYLQTDTGNIQGPLDMEIDATFRLWGYLND